MSALTKLFVGLLVVLSLLLSAASITFLHTVPNFNEQIATLRAGQAAAQAQAERVRATETALRTAAEQRAAEQQLLLSAAATEASSLRGELAKSEADKAALQGQIAQSNTTQATLSQAVTLNMGLVNELRTQLGELRETYDRTLQQNLEIGTQLAKVSNDNEYLQRALRAVQEQNVNLLGQAENFKRIIVALGGNPDDPSENPIAPPRINGVVVQRQVIDAQPYALISVGSEDDVKAGMRFTVIDPETSRLLGFVTIEEVDDQVSIGKLSGPHIDEISANDEVRTQV